MRTKMRVYLFWLTLLIALPLPVFGQESKDVVKLKSYVSASAIRPDDKFKVAVELSIDEKYHINGNIPSWKGALPTEVHFAPPSGIQVGEVKYPSASLKKFPWMPDTELAVYEGLVII